MNWQKHFEKLIKNQPKVNPVYSRYIESRKQEYERIVKGNSPSAYNAQ